MLIETTPEFNNACLLSHHYLNDPKCVINDFMDSMYRQTPNEETFISVVLPILKKYKYNKPTEVAKAFFAWRSNITLKEFVEANVNTYIHELPKHVELRNDYINNWYANNKNEVWSGGMLISSTTPSYPYKFIW